jgi:hypothetical protein
MEAIIAYCIANYLAFRCYVGTDGLAVWVVENQHPVGLIPPGAISGVGATLEGALKAYMSKALDQRAVVKEPLVSYVAEPTADIAVVDAFGKDTIVAIPVVKPPLVDVPVVDVLPTPIDPLIVPVVPSVETTGKV